MCHVQCSGHGSSSPSDVLGFYAIITIVTILSSRARFVSSRCVVGCVTAVCGFCCNRPLLPFHGCDSGAVDAVAAALDADAVTARPAAPNCPRMLRLPLISFLALAAFELCAIVALTCICDK